MTRLESARVALEELRIFAKRKARETGTPTELGEHTIDLLADTVSYILREAEAKESRLGDRWLVRGPDGWGTFETELTAREATAALSRSCKIWSLWYAKLVSISPL